MHEAFYPTTELSFMPMVSINKLQNRLVLKGGENEKWVRTQECRENYATSVHEDRELFCVGVALRQIKMLLEKEGNYELVSFMNFIIFSNCIAF